MVYKPIACTARRGVSKSGKLPFLSPPCSAPRKEFLPRTEGETPGAGRKRRPGAQNSPRLFRQVHRGSACSGGAPVIFRFVPRGKKAFFSRRFRQSSPQRFFRDRARRLCSTILPVVRPNRSSRAGTEPTSPNSSSTPTRSTGSGYSLQSSSHTAEYSPPMTL